MFFKSTKLQQKNDHHYSNNKSPKAQTELSHINITVIIKRAKTPSV